jgi:hypothetical protein
MRRLKNGFAACETFFKRLAISMDVNPPRHPLENRDDLPIFHVPGAVGDAVGDDFSAGLSVMAWIV